MDIKPFVMPEFNLWTDFGYLWIVLVVISILMIVGGTIYVVKNKKNEKKLYWGSLTPFLGMIIFLFVAMPVAISAQATAKTEAYNSHESQVTNKLDEDGFSVISGTLDLHPNTQSSLLLSYEGKNFDCTLFTPKDVNTSIVFSCGEAKLTLDEIKESATS